MKLDKNYVNDLMNEVLDSELAKEKTPAIKRGLEIYSKGRRSCLSTYRRLQKNYYLTDAENEIVKEFIQKMRENCA